MAEMRLDPSTPEQPSEGAGADAAPEAPQEPAVPDAPMVDAMQPISLEASLDSFGDPTVSTGYGQAASMFRRERGACRGTL